MKTEFVKEYGFCLIPVGFDTYTITPESPYFAELFEEGVEGGDGIPVVWYQLYSHGNMVKEFPVYDDDDGKVLCQFLRDHVTSDENIVLGLFASIWQFREEYQERGGEEFIQSEWYNKDDKGNIQPKQGYPVVFFGFRK
jgi:hypothetical protein